MTLTKEWAEAVGPVVRWARENGWQHDAYPRHACTERWRVYYWRTAVSFTNRRTGHEQVIGVRTAQQAIDVLAALGVIPARFSSQWREGRDVALKAIASSVLLPYDLPPGVQDQPIGQRSHA